MFVTHRYVKEVHVDTIELYFDHYFEVLTFIQDEMSDLLPGLSPTDVWPEHKLQPGVLIVAEDLQLLCEVANRLEDKYGIIVPDNELLKLFDSPIDNLIEFVLAKREIPSPV